MGYVGAHRTTRAPLGFRPAYVAVGLFVIGGWTAGATLTIGGTPARHVQRPAEALGLSAYLEPGAEQPVWPYSVDPAAPAGPTPEETRPTSIQAQPVADLTSDDGTARAARSWFTPLVPQLPPPPYQAPTDPSRPWPTSTTTARPIVPVPSTTGAPTTTRPGTTTLPSTTLPSTTGPTTEPTTTQPTTTEPTTEPTTAEPTTTQPTTAEPTTQPTTEPTASEPTSRPELTSTTPPPTTPPPTEDPTTGESTTRESDPTEDQDATTT